MIQIHEQKQNIPAEEFRDDLCRLLTSPEAEQVLNNDRDLIADFIPELKPSFTCEQNNPYHVYDVWRHTLAAIENSPPNLTIRLALLFHDIGKPYTKSTDKRGIDHFYGHTKHSAALTKEIMGRLRFDDETVRLVSELVKIHDNHIEDNPAAVRRYVTRMGVKQFMAYLAVRQADMSAQNPEFFEPRLKAVEAARQMVLEIASDEV